MPLQSTPNTSVKGGKSKTLGEAVPASSLGMENYLLKASLAGPSGSGKTQSASTLPGKLLLIDYDGRSETLAGNPNVDIINCYDPEPTSPKAWMKARDVKRELWSQVRAGTLSYDGVIEDGLTQMNRYAMNWALLTDPKRGLGGSPAKQHYIPQMKAIADHILSMKSLPCHYILTTHLEILEDEEMGGLKYLPKTTGKQRTEVPGWFNECYLCHREKDKDGTLRYYWTTAGTGKWDFLKSTLNQLGKYWKDPIEIDFSKEKVGFQMLLGRRFTKD